MKVFWKGLALDPGINTNDDNIYILQIGYNSMEWTSTEIVSMYWRDSTDISLAPKGMGWALHIYTSLEIELVHIAMTNELDEKP